MESFTADIIFNFFVTVAVYVAFAVTAAAFLLMLRYSRNMPDFAFRKALHMAAVLSILPILVVSENHYVAIASAIAVLIGIDLCLIITERLPFHTKLFVEKRKHEVIFNFTSFFTLFILSILLTWGIRGELYRYIVFTTFFTWGTGDAAAAVVGTMYGKHKITGPLVDGEKSVEGSVAMFLFSYVGCLVSLYLSSGIPGPTVILLSLVVGVLASVTELFTKFGLDNITVPVIVFAVLSIQSLLV